MITVTLKHARNPDVQGGYWQPPVDPAKAQYVRVACIADASKACVDYIARNNLGGGNWTGGDIKSETTGKIIGNVSYNGKVWPGRRTEWKPGQTPLYTPTSNTAGLNLLGLGAQS